MRVTATKEDDVSVSSPASDSISIEATLCIVRMRTRLFWPLSASLYEKDSDVFRGRERALRLSPSTSRAAFLDMAGEMILQIYGLEIRAAKLPNGLAKYVGTTTCLINHHAYAKGASAIVVVTDETSWSAALQLMQTTQGDVRIIFRFGKKGDESSNCTVQ
jgi:hypothetical protein